MFDLGNTNLPLSSYAKVVFRHKNMLFILTFLGLILGICTGILLPRQYKSSTVILVQEGKTDNPMFDKLAVATTIQQRMIGIRESILGWNSMVELVKRLNLAADIRNRQQFENLILTLRRNLSIRLQGQNLIYLDYIGEEPAKTQAVVQTITDILIDKNVEIQNQETADAIKFIEEQLQVYKSKIKSAEIAQLEDQLKTLLIDSTEKHPLVKQLMEQIDKKKSELQEENLQYIKDIKLNNQAVTPLVEEIRKALDTLETKPATSQPSADAAAGRDYYKVMLIDKLDNVMGRDVGVNEEIYNTLLQRLETAKITQRLQSSKEGTRYTVLDPPREPLRPIKPNRLLVALAGLFLGLAAGVGIILLEEFLDQSFIDVEEAKSFLGVPLLGAISKITTEEAIRDQRASQIWLYTLTVVAGLLLLVSTLALAKIIY